MRRAILAIVEALVAADPSSSALQRELATSYSNVGNVQVALGDPTGARTSYGRGMAIIETLAAVDPSSSALQRDLASCYWQLASIADPDFPWSRVVEKLEEMEVNGILFPADRRALVEARKRAMGSQSVEESSE